MKSPLAALALFGTLAAGSAWAQSDSQGGAQTQGVPSPNSAAFPNINNARASSPGDARVFSGTAALPEPTPVSELKPPTIDLPKEPVEPYLLTKDVGPFMVLARVFRGPESERMALALVKELRSEYQLPAFILRTKDYPGKSMIRGVPPTAHSEVKVANIGMPEKIRTFDEAAVLVGNEKTLADSEKLLHRVRKINPKCLEGMPKLYFWRTGLAYAIRTTNPYAPAQTLYQRTTDKLVVQMNGGLRSIINCPGRYSMQVAEFTGHPRINSAARNSGLSTWRMCAPARFGRRPPTPRRWPTSSPRTRMWHGWVNRSTFTTTGVPAAFSSVRSAAKGTPRPRNCAMPC